ncbi:hypothetical protein [Saccharopolyspora hirsuta]|nr:hypothetical protein [Saccharopolyspora hirsuta]
MTDVHDTSEVDEIPLDEQQRRDWQDMITSLPNIASDAGGEVYNQ